MELPPENPIKQWPPTQPNAWPSDLDTQVAPPSLNEADPLLPIPEPAVPVLDGSADREERTRSNFLRLLPVFLAFGVLGLVTSLWAIPRIEDSLQEEAREALVEKGIKVGSVTFDGRDAKLAGFPDDMSAEAFAAVADVSGVRSVEFVDQEATVANQVELDITVDNGELRIAGTVLNNTQAKQLRTAAEDTFGRDNFVDDIVVADEADSAVIDSEDARVRQLSEFIVSLGLASVADVQVQGPSIDIEAVVADIDANTVMTLGATGLSDFTSRQVNIQTGPAIGIDPEIDDDSDEPSGFLIPAEPQLALIADEFNSASSFEPGSATLTTEGEVALDKLTELLGDFDGLGVQVTGHTDNTGDAIENVRLSQRRADAVVDYLVAAGVSSDRLVAIGLGSAKPAASNDTDDGRAQNRRVEFEIAG